MKKKPPILNVDLDRWHDGRDVRLERAYQHGAEWRWALWCQERYRGKRCNTPLGHVMDTSEGFLWEAAIYGVAEWILPFARAPRRARRRADCQPASTLAVNGLTTETTTSGRYAVATGQPPFRGASSGRPSPRT
jgi:hypothetical protein